MRTSVYTFHLEVTDTFGGDANYCWVKRYAVRARTARGAMRVLARHYGGYWNLDYDCGDLQRYNMHRAAICCFVSYPNEFDTSDRCALN